MTVAGGEMGRKVVQVGEVSGGDAAEGRVREGAVGGSASAITGSQENVGQVETQE
jgi:hypothetical protein